MGKFLKIKPVKRSRSFSAYAGWKEIDNRRIYFRSSWEFRYAAYLQFLKKQNYIVDWEYEPKTFWFEKIKRGTRSYKPDFLVHNTDHSHYWVEVKGYMDKKSETKINRFYKYFPNERLDVITKTWFVQNHCILDTIQKMDKKSTGLQFEGEEYEEK